MQDPPVFGELLIVVSGLVFDRKTVNFCYLNGRNCPSGVPLDEPFQQVQQLHVVGCRPWFNKGLVKKNNRHVYNAESYRV